MPDIVQKIRNHKRVEELSDERAIGNGVIVTLKKGWSFDPSQDNRIRGEDTYTQILKEIRGAYRFEGPYDD